MFQRRNHFCCISAAIKPVEIKGIQNPTQRGGQSGNKDHQKILHEEGCNLLLVKPHNHHVNAAERTIQTFKAHFISALATTNSKFPLQLWDCLMPQVENTLNMMCPLCINPNISAYEALHGLYDWNCFPLAPPGCKAVVNKSPETWGLWDSRGIDAWWVRPSLGHYRCNLFFIPDTCSYRISGSAELFPQHF